MACQHCMGKGFVRRTVDGYDTIAPCQCSIQPTLETHFQRAGIPSRYWNWTLQSESGNGKSAFEIPWELKKWILSSPLDDKRKSFKPWNGPKKGNRDTFHAQFSALKKCRALLNIYIDHFIHKTHQGEVPGLLMMGTVGIGKTHLLCTFLTDLIYAGLTDVYFMEMTDLMKKLQFSYGKGSSSREEDILNPLVRSEVLVLDDLGSFATDNRSWILNTLGFVLNKRYSFNKPTLITTNYFDSPGKGESSLTDCLGTRLRSRIRETCPELIMRGFDYRSFGQPNDKGKA